MFLKQLIENLVLNRDENNAWVCLLEVTGVPFQLKKNSSENTSYECVKNGQKFLKK